jgi:biopolymer transport protein TolQ
MTVLPLAFFLQDTAATPSGPLSGPHSNAIVDMVHNSGPTALTVLGILLIASIVSWAIIIAKWRAFNEADVQSKRFLRAFRKSGRLSEISSIADQFKPSPLVAVFHEIHDQYQRQACGRGQPPNPQALERAAQTAASESRTIMKRRMTGLATTAQCAPFVGLFGTVMGIIDFGRELLNAIENAAIAQPQPPAYEEARSRRS